MDAPPIKEGISITRKRELPVNGEILVGVGEVITSDTIVAKTELPGSLYIIRVSDELGIHPSEIKESIIVTEKDNLVRGQIVAKRKGLFGIFSSQVVSSYDGKIEFISEALGHIGVRGQPRTISLKAHYPGRISAVNDSRGVTIEANGTLIPGIFGIGGERTGKIHCLKILSSERVGKEHIPSDCSGLILCGGCAPTLEALQIASERGAKAFVTGSITDDVLSGYLGYDISVAITGNEAVAMTVVVTEGFGIIPIDDKIEKTLKQLQGRDASLSGATQVRAGAVRPEIFVG